MFKRTNNDYPLLIKKKKIINIFRLNFDCLEKILDFLSLKDVVNFSKTCKFFHELSQYCIQKHCSKFILSCTPYKIKIYNNNGNIDHILHFFSKLELYSYGLDSYNIYQQKLTNLKEINICGITKNEYTDLKTIKIPSTIEKIFLIACDLTFFPSIKLCKNLNTLKFYSCFNPIVVFDKYPRLETFILVPGNKKINLQILIDFFKINTTIKKFATSSKFLCKEEEFFSILSNEISFDVFCLELEANQIEKTSLLLNNFYSYGFFKSLEISIIGPLNQKHVDYVSSISGLKKLGYYSNEVLLYSPNVHTLIISEVNQFDSLLMLMKSVKCIYLKNGDLKRIISILKFEQIEKIILKKISVQDLNLFDLNQLRNSLPNAQKITIYVNDFEFSEIVRNHGNNYNKIKLMCLDDIEKNLNWSGLFHCFE